MVKKGGTMKKIVLAGGCFWGVEEYYRRLKGVTDTRVGYAQGHNQSPSYQEVCTGLTEHAEVVEIIYDEQVIPYEKILEHLFRICDPTSLNRQGNDIGTQYRAGVYPETEEDIQAAKSYIQLRQKEYHKPIVLEVEKLKEFYDAESYHQKYLVKNPTGYCHVNMNLIRPDERKNA
jgi:peptide-methionine (S)-S-oxide reductase